ncbi:hypothetical protein D3C74_457280 [compost metagenome]
MMTRIKLTWTRSAISGLISCRVTYEVPKSPKGRPSAQSKYCTISGRSVPNSARVLANSSGVAFTPSAICAGSPGMALMKKNTATVATT